MITYRPLSKRTCFGLGAEELGRCDVMKLADLVVVVLLFCIFFIPVEVFGMGWIEPIIGGGGGGGAGPVSAPEPGVITLIGIGVAGGTGYLLGKRRK